MASERVDPMSHYRVKNCPTCGHYPWEIGTFPAYVDCCGFHGCGCKHGCHLRPVAGEPGRSGTWGPDGHKALCEFWKWTKDSDFKTCTCGWIAEIERRRLARTKPVASVEGTGTPEQCCGHHSCGAPIKPDHSSYSGYKHTHEAAWLHWASPRSFGDGLQETQKILLPCSVCGKYGPENEAHALVGGHKFTTVHEPVGTEQEPPNYALSHVYENATFLAIKTRAEAAESQVEKLRECLREGIELVGGSETGTSSFWNSFRPWCERAEKLLKP